MYVVHFDCCEKTKGDSSARWKAWGIPSVFVALVRPWRLPGRFQAGCMCVCGSILLDRVSSACQVVEFVGACAAMLWMGWSEEAGRYLDLSR
jgi:hypothetical protein